MPRHFSSWASPPQPAGEPSRDLAIDYLRKAGLAGNKEARYQLARLLIDQGGEEERKEAQSILEKLAKNDTGAASLLLGEGTLQGWFGDEADFEKKPLLVGAIRRERRRDRHPGPRPPP